VTSLQRFYLRVAAVFFLSVTAVKAPLRETFAADAKVIEAAKKEGELA